ncbi:hypothetical protein MRB53_009584 [Persea americana]|uniref:Uncharacterized protein n=1 Tax=Persea americana TaxID=3435 RepID=A0ACC2LPK0_PERAE|nr:hypothetical protein MRB53_009584 [Persea americana]
MQHLRKRLAALVGCNYHNSRYELHGCINDVHAMRNVLLNRFGFDPSHIGVLTDAPGSPVMPTGANIRATLSRMVDQAEPGDVLFFHYSGHGTRIPAQKHGSKQDEAIVPCDFNLITDVDFRQLVNRLPEGASFTVISDSCHSGGLIDKEKEQIGPHTTTLTSTQRRRTIPFDSILDHLTTLSGIASTDVGIHLLEAFGSESSAKFRSFGPDEDASRPLRPDNGILLSGCQANETSADMDPTEDGTKACGAFSNAIQTILKAHDGLLSNREVVTHARELLGDQGLDQHPCLYCSDENANAPFLWQPVRSRT